MNLKQLSLIWASICQWVRVFCTPFLSAAKFGYAQQLFRTIEYCSKALSSIHVDGSCSIYIKAWSMILTIPSKCPLKITCEGSVMNDTIVHSKLSYPSECSSVPIQPRYDTDSSSQVPHWFIHLYCDESIARQPPGWITSTDVENNIL